MAALTDAARDVEHLTSAADGRSPRCASAALTPSKTRQMSLAGGAERHLEVESLCFLEMIDHLEKIASLRIAAGT
jgi:hypothetical protein